MSDVNDITDRDYFQARAEDERVRARASTDARIGKIHLKLAARYDDLAGLTAGDEREVTK